MKPNELMVGDFFRVSTKSIAKILEIQTLGPHPIAWISVNKGSFSSVIPLIRLSPIPITEDILLKNGFDEPFYRTDTKCSTHVKSLDNGCELWIRFHVPRKYWYLDVVNEDSFVLVSGKVDFLHQLQNLCNIAGVDMEWKV